jgi:hypothetical protein
VRIPAPRSSRLPGGRSEHRFSGESTTAFREFGGAGEESVGFSEAVGLLRVAQSGTLVRRGEAGAESGLDGIQQEVARGQHREFRDGIDFCVGLRNASEGGGTRRGCQFVPRGVASLILPTVPPVPREKGARDQEQHEQVVHARCLEPSHEFVVDSGIGQIGGLNLLETIVHD